jgi:hypothetical protein
MSTQVPATITLFPHLLSIEGHKMIYVRSDTGEIVSEYQIRRENPQVSFPKPLSDAAISSFGYAEAQETARPSTQPWERATKNTTAQNIDGVWYIGWTVEDIPATAEGVKNEAYRRIVVIVPEWKQRNLTAQAAQLAEKGRANWTAEELAAWNSGQVIWDQVAAIRAKSDALEAMSPIPVDYKDDRWWV